MAKDLSELVRSADWKLEKHVPAITAPAEAKAGEWIDVDVSVGQEIPHPNTVEHHIVWIALHYAPEGSPLSIELGKSSSARMARGPSQTKAPRTLLPPRASASSWRSPARSTPSPTATSTASGPAPPTSRCARSVH